MLQSNSAAAVNAADAVAVTVIHLLLLLQLLL
jgi:hypothetical protein